MSVTTVLPLTLGSLAVLLAVPCVASLGDACAGNALVCDDFSSSEEACSDQPGMTAKLALAPLSVGLCNASSAALRAASQLIESDVSKQSLNICRVHLDVVPGPADWRRLRRQRRSLCHISGPSELHRRPRLQVEPSLGQGLRCWFVDSALLRTIS